MVFKIYLSPLRIVKIMQILKFIPNIGYIDLKHQLFFNKGNLKYFKKIITLQ